MALAALHRDEEAVRIFAASGAVRAEIGYVRGVREIAGIERVTTELRARLGDDLYESAFAEGSVLSAEEALAYASRGRGERKRPAHGWASLTPAERDVTDLAARGLRNKDIAEKLFVTPATVKTHLAHVFAKLGVRTRAELAAFVAEVAGRTS
jgi:DNA-binding CsgD family transcriptional regulator